MWFYFKESGVNPSTGIHVERKIIMADSTEGSKEAKHGSFLNALFEILRIIAPIIIPYIAGNKG